MKTFVRVSRAIRKVLPDSLSKSRKRRLVRQYLDPEMWRYAVRQLELYV